MSQDLLKITLAFSPLDVTTLGIPDRHPTTSVKVLPTEEEEEELMDLEAMLPRLPEELNHQDLTAYGLHWKRWLDWEEWGREVARWNFSEAEELELLPATMGKVMLPATMSDPAGTWLEEVSVQAGSACYRSIRYPMNLQTPTCYVCKRALQLFTVAVHHPQVNRGWCPQCLALKEWEQAWRNHAQQHNIPLLQRQSLPRKAYRMIDAPGAEALRQRFLHQRMQALLSEWRALDQAWWDQQTDQKTTLYSRWRTKQLSSLNSKPPT